MGEQEQIWPVEFEPHCHQFRWMLDHLGGWQFGEQELIPAILEQLGEYFGAYIEFGAGDGKSLPLTIDRLYAPKSPENCYLVEIDAESRRKLSDQYPNAVVTDGIDWKQFARRIVAVVVIDIDGRDSIVLNEMLSAGCRPALVVCEHMDRHYSIGTTAPNPIPEWLLGTKLKTGHCIADTAETLHWMAAKFGYERIGLNRCNSFFVRRDLFPRLFKG